MPELLEIELYRQGIATLVGRTISSIEAPDEWYLKNIDARTLADALVGTRVERIRRHGKLLLVDVTSVTVGLRFGMTGIPVVDRLPVLSALEYSSKRVDPEWNRFSLTFDGAGSLAINDPRRLGGVELDPDVSRLGPDAWAVSREELTGLLARYRVATKSLLLNQKRLAGLGNLLVDELLWRSNVLPSKACNELTDREAERVWRELHPMLDELFARGGSTEGDHFSERHIDGRCPRDGSEMVHATVGGRSTWWCVRHQK